jgi:hypothetical protein
VPLSALQRRIIELSSRLVCTDDVNQFKELASELRRALHEHIMVLRHKIDDTKNNISLIAAAQFASDQNQEQGAPR